MWNEILLAVIMLHLVGGNAAFVYMAVKVEAAGQPVKYFGTFSDFRETRNHYRRLRKSGNLPLWPLILDYTSLAAPVAFILLFLLDRSLMDRMLQYAQQLQTPRAMLVGVLVSTAGAAALAVIFTRRVLRKVRAAGPDAALASLLRSDPYLRSDFWMALIWSGFIMVTLSLYLTGSWPQLPSPPVPSPR